MDAKRQLTQRQFARSLPIANDDLLAAIRRFLAAWWERIGLQAMLAPVEMPNQSEVAVQVIHNPADLATINPFAPVMHNNTASLIDTFIKDHLGALVAAILRPCELRTIVELQKRRRISVRRSSENASFGNLLTIGFDCLGTLSAHDYANRVKTHGIEQITREAVTHIMNGEPLPDSRTFCRICDSPAPYGADVTIGLIGVRTSQHLLVIAKDEYTYTHLGIIDVTDEQVDEQQLAERETNLGIFIAQQTTIREQLIAHNSRTNAGLSDLLAWCTRCTLCTDCLDACPLYNGELAGALGVGGIHERGRPVLSELVDVSRWLASCSGCGMCHEACERGVPLTLLIASLSHRIRRELNYTPGHPEQPLPWIRSDT